MTQAVNGVSGGYGLGLTSKQIRCRSRDKRRPNKSEEQPT